MGGCGDSEVLVVGGGPSGLCAALAAAQVAEVQIFEAERSLCGSGGRAEIHRLVSCEKPQEKQTLQSLSELGVVVQETGKSVVLEILRSLTDAVQKNPKIRVHTSSPVTRLLHSERGCYGCAYQRPDGEVQAKGKVLLCCGGFLADAQLLRRHRPDLLHWPIPLLSAAPSAPRLVPSAQLSEPRVKLFATAEVPEVSRRVRRLLPLCLRGRILSRQGEVAMAGSEEDLAAEILRQGPCWLLAESVAMAPRDSLKRFSLRDLAEEMEVSAAWLRKLGDLGAARADEDMSVWAVRVEPALLFCEGGLAGENGAVLASDGSAIPGLFVAGEAAGLGSSMFSCVSSACLAAASARRAAAVEAAATPLAIEASEAWPEPLIPAPALTLSTRVAVGRLKDFLDKELTAEALQKALLQSADHGDLGRASEELSQQLRRRWGPQSGEAVTLRLRDPVSNLLACAMKAALPQAGEVTSEVPTTCVHCRMPLKLQVSVELVNGHPRKEKVQQEASGGRYAYATLLYGRGVEYFLGALVLGWSLNNHECQAERLLLHTKDVPASYLDALSQYWSLREVGYLSGDQSMYEKYKMSRFQDVFTKLQALACTDYSKVLMMDLDMLVRGNLDELFQLRAPAALKRCSGREQPPHGGDFTSEDFYTRQADKMSSGMNAGVMLLEPNQEVYERMVKEIQDKRHPEHLNTFGPEQDYLARFFGCFSCGKWTHLHAKFNYQPNLPDDYVGQAHRSIDVLQDVMVAHYSGGRVKPWKIDGLDLNANGVRRLLEDDSLKELMGGQRFPSKTRLMDKVEIAPGNDELGPEVRQLMWEWVLALRQCNRELLEGAVDLLSLLS